MSICRILERLKSIRPVFSIQTINLVLLRVLRRELIKTGRCIGCGSCCTMINLRIGTTWLKSTESFERAKGIYPEYERFCICGTDRQGFLQFTCTFLDQDGSCREYENRLDICRSFPNKSLILCGGRLPARCGYQIVPGIPFGRRLRRAVRKYEKETDSSD